MIKQIAGLGVMSALGSPLLLKLVPKQLLGTVVKKVANHYLQSGQHLQEAMRDATEQAFTAINMGLKPSVFRKLTGSKATKEFVTQFQEGYLEAFLKENTGIDRETFCDDSAKACRKILKELDTLLDTFVPEEEDVHRFFSKGEMEKIEERMNEGEMRLIKRLNQFEEVQPAFLSLLCFEHLLFQGIHYFFRQELTQKPSVKAIFDELSDLKLIRSTEEARYQRQVMQVQLTELQKSLGDLTEQLKGASGDARTGLQKKQALLLQDEGAMREQVELLREDLLQETEAQWNTFNQRFDGFERRLGQQVQMAREDIRQAREQIVYEIAKLDIHLHQQDRVLDEIRSLLYNLVRRGSDASEYVQTASSMIHSTFHGKPTGQWQPLVRQAASGAGISNQEVERIVEQASHGGRTSTAKRQKVPHAVLEVMGQGDTEARSYTIFFSEQVSLGRHSSNDLVLYWYPLPDPPDQTNAEWRNWQGTGACHPTLNISGVHLELVWFSGTLHLKDHSSKGTFVNRERVKKGKLISLSEGALISAAEVVTLSYSILRDENDRPVGWRLRRMNNTPGREEYLFLEAGAQASIGASSMDAIAFSAPGLRANHLQIKRDGDKLVLMPTKQPSLLNGDPLDSSQILETSARLQLGEQVIWCFPPQG